ncbi:MarR family transcriptional regulator [Aeromonas hydrophila]|jgi:predicted ArsR family transcriptional regulator|uniref:Transcriptional regulator n=1 Tax=Aeromonas hydrophila TaxID=644 RepID=A0AAX3P5T6_AERHY|nr:MULTISPECIES: metalloregulator ArsR/SmtB family transcription factor [Aeromonas]GKQ63309.1 transcriptional regulator [Aeromonas caviae]MCO4115683.1 transcriptional regulator [Aeromonas hydrophila]MCV9381081.1 transcriptional regulator [Aeromonas hydrophila]MDD9226817.1 transcriptional regulator [Aeromonas hydrophila]ONG05166.1 MarR family transcriptional regulator [Aeromonas hydrophila]
MNASTDKILFLLKSHGPQSAAELGEQLQMTSMGARQHLMTLEADGWVSFNDEARGRGRPVRLWHLTEQAWQRFPDSHSELTLQLIDNIQQLFGEVGMERLIAQREQQQLARYQAELTQPALADRLAALTAQRTREGYMADFRQEEDGSWLLWESHCPICAAARACRGFCRSELEMFRRLLAPAGVDREQYLLEGDHRCLYRIRPQP